MLILLEFSLKNKMKKEKIRQWIENLLGSAIVLVIFTILLSLISKLGDGWSRVSPEEKQRIESERSIYLNEVKMCNNFLSNDFIDFNNPKFKKCSEIINRFESGANQQYE